MCDGHRNKNVKEHRIELVPQARPLKVASFRAGSKTRRLVDSGMEKQLDTRVISRWRSKWATPFFSSQRQI